jgi:hypothetical protein
MQRVTKIPKVLCTFIRALNNHDSGSLIKTFAKDAFVHDSTGGYNGILAIANWCNTQLIEKKVTYEIHEIFEHYGDFMLVVQAEGEYNKYQEPDPLVLDNFYTMRNDTITSLLILKNQDKSGKPIC